MSKAQEDGSLGGIMSGFHRRSRRDALWGISHRDILDEQEDEAWTLIARLGVENETKFLNRAMEATFRGITAGKRLRR